MGKSKKTAGAKPAKKTSKRPLLQWPQDDISHQTIIALLKRQCPVIDRQIAPDTLFFNMLYAIADCLYLKNQGLLEQLNTTELHHTLGNQLPQLTKSPSPEIVFLFALIIDNELLSTIFPTLTLTTTQKDRCLRDYYRYFIDNHLTKLADYQNIDVFILHRLRKLQEPKSCVQLAQIEDLRQQPVFAAYYYCQAAHWNYEPAINHIAQQQADPWFTIFQHLLRADDIMSADCDDLFTPYQLRQGWSININCARAIASFDLSDRDDQVIHNLLHENNISLSPLADQIIALLLPNCHYGKQCYDSLKKLNPAQLNNQNYLAWLPPLLTLLESDRKHAIDLLRQKTTSCTIEKNSLFFILVLYVEARFDETIYSLRPDQEATILTELITNRSTLAAELLIGLLLCINAEKFLSFDSNSR